MTRDDLGQTAQRRLEANNLCPKCNKVITDTDNILFTIIRKRRCKQYTFYHERCLIDGEKEIKEPTQ